MLLQLKSQQDIYVIGQREHAIYNVKQKLK